MSADRSNLINLNADLNHQYPVFVFITSETCKQTQCKDGRKCVIKGGRPRCVCKPDCTQSENSTSHRGPVCATNGKEYKSMCAFLKMKCRQQDQYLELDVAYNGLCQSKSNTHFTLLITTYCMLNGLWSIFAIIVSSYAHQSGNLWLLSKTGILTWCIPKYMHKMQILEHLDSVCLRSCKRILKKKHFCTHFLCYHRMPEKMLQAWTILLI